MPGTSPTLLPSTEASAGLATCVWLGSSSGSSVTAVRALSVLAGRNRWCGAFAASTSPVSASATNHDPMERSFGRAGAPGSGATTTPVETVYLANVQGPIAFFGPDGTIAHVSTGEQIRQRWHARQTVTS